MKSILILFSFTLLTLGAGNTVFALNIPRFCDARGACYGGDLKACIQAGEMHEKEGNIDEAIYYYAKACRGGESLGCVKSGLLGHIVIP